MSCSSKPRLGHRLPWLAGLALLTIVGCAGAEPPAARPVPAEPVLTGPVPVLQDGADARLPLDPFLLTPPQVDQVTRAHRALLAQCAGRFGLTAPPTTAAPTGPRTLNERRYGITDPGRAAAAGYRLSAHEPNQPPARSTTPRADPTLLAVLSGDGPRIVHGQPVPAGGCYQETRRRLHGADRTVAEEMLAQRLSHDSYDQSGQDPRVQAVAGLWSQCMRAHGYDYRGPLDPPADRRFRGQVSAAEIATAAADIACKRKNNLVGIWFAVESSYQLPQIAANRAGLERIRRTNIAELGVARSLGIR